MSNYQFRSLHSERLTRLFTDLEQETSLLSPAAGLQVAGWTWECDPVGFYLKCAPELNSVLGIDAQEFLAADRDPSHGGALQLERA